MHKSKRVSRLPVWIAAASIGVALACAPSKRFPWRLEKPGVAMRPSAVQTVNRSYDRVKSRVLVRRVARATRANLDHAAYVANVMLVQPRDERILTLEGSFVPPKPFGGVIVPETLCASLEQTPVSSKERGRPLAFVPMVDYLARWNSEKTAGLEQARSTVRDESWGLARLPGLYLQEISVAYLHQGKLGPEIWVEIEFQPWAKLFDEMPDTDGDGYPSVFGKLDDKLVNAEVVAQIERDYASRVLDPSQVRRWANELASYWYPSYNTDVVDMGQAAAWPLGSTEMSVVEELSGLSVKHPVAVIRGKPHGAPIYNVFQVAGMQGAQAGAGAPAGANSAQLKQVPVAADTSAGIKALEQELAAAGGSWDGWGRAVAPIHTGLRRVLKRRPKQLQGLIGRGGFLFYRKSLDYVVGGDIQQQKPGKNPFATIVAFKDYLKRLNVDFLLVPVPTKSEVFPDKLSLGRVKAAGSAINPYGRKFLHELLQAGVEVVDLLPAYLAARTQRAKGDEPLYQPQDTHWTDRGLRLAAELIGKRVKRYGWYPALAQQSIAYTLKRVTFKQFGDLHSRLGSREQGRYKPAKLVGHQVITPEGTPYEDALNSPIVVLGDSFTGVYQRTYCEHAGVSAHIAHQIGSPVDLVMSYGGGPNVRKKLMTRGEADLKGRRLVIWVFAARDFHNYWEDWEPLASTKD